MCVAWGFPRILDVAGGFWNIKNFEWQFFLAIRTNMLPSSSEYYSRTTPKMEAANSFEASITNYQYARLHIRRLIYTFVFPFLIKIKGNPINFTHRSKSYRSFIEL
jgi:hypothetical protein